MSDNSLEKLLAVIEPKIHDINESRLENTSLKKVHETMDELVKLGENSYQEIINFYDQEFILKAIKIGNSNASSLIDQFETAKYLLKNESYELQELPQYKDAINFMDQLYQYLYGLNQKISLEYEEKKVKLQVQEILNKYYSLLNKNPIVIKEVDEFLTFLDLNKLDIQDRLNILMYINKCNIKNYITTNDIDIGNNVNLSTISKIIYKNNSLLNKPYDSTNLEQDLEVYLNQDLDNIENNLINRKIFVVNETKMLYDRKDYSNIIKYYDEYQVIISLEKELEKQKNNSKLIFLMKNGKSLVRDYLDNTNIKYKSCIYKNLLDLENTEKFNLPIMCYNNHYLYVKDEFVVKCIYTYLDDYVLVLGVLDKKEELNDFINKNEYLLEEIFNNQNIEYNDEERNIILQGIKLEDLILSIDLNTLDIKKEDKNGRENY